MISQEFVIFAIVYWSYFLTAVVFLSTLRSVPVWGTRTKNAGLIALVVVDLVKLENHPINFVSVIAAVFLKIVLLAHRVLLIISLLLLFVFLHVFVYNPIDQFYLLYTLIGFGLFCVVWLVLLRKKTLS